MLHYCLPGPVSYLVDEIVRLVRLDYETVPRWYRDESWLDFV